MPCLAALAASTMGQFAYAAKEIPQGYMSVTTIQAVPDDALGHFNESAHTNDPNELFRECTESEECIGVFQTRARSWHFLRHAHTAFAACCDSTCAEKGMPQDHCVKTLYAKHALPPNYCGHGKLDMSVPPGTCVCEENWQTAGITDTFHFLQGSCAQFACQSDQVCEEELGIEGATCPVENWNCYCGWWYAFGNGLTGWEPESGRAKCMGIMYTFSIWAFDVLILLLNNLYRIFLPISLALLPFGRKRGACDHHRPSLWSMFRHAVGQPSTCRGECVNPDQYGWSSLADDLAWSLYIIEVMVWSYLFCTALYAIALFIWAVVLWTLVILMLIAACIAAACVALAQGAGECGGDCSCGSCECAGLDTECCFFGGAGGGGSPVETDMFYFASPHHGFVGDWGYWGYVGGDPYSSQGGNGDCCSCCKCRTICCPIAWLFYVFPIMPENAWGGLVGYMVLGTHQRTPPDRMYAGGDQLTEFLRMGWRRPGDLHRNSDWRQQVFDFIMGPEEAPAHVAAAPSLGQVYMHDGEARDVIAIGRSSKAVLIRRQFDKDRDECFSSSYDDYKEGVCWICQDRHDEWDMWLSCRHLFCSRCSTQMLSRRMPCPLCRIASSTVLRGSAYTPHQPAGYRPPLQDPGEHQEDTPLLPNHSQTSANSQPMLLLPPDASQTSTDTDHSPERSSVPAQGAQEHPQSPPRQPTPRPEQPPALIPLSPPSPQAPQQMEIPQPEPPMTGPSPTGQTRTPQQLPQFVAPPAAPPTPPRSAVVALPWNTGAHSIAGTKPNDPHWQCQDSYLVLPMGGSRILVAVFDGHGYSEHGRKAAETARYIFEREAARHAEVPLSSEAAKALLMTMFEQAHSALMEHPSIYAYAGTTATAAIVDEVEGVVHLGFVGDSRLIVTDAAGQVAFRTQDHVIDDAAEQRVLACGGEVRMADISGINARRVYQPGLQYPGIMMSRSLGDLQAHAIGLQHNPEVHTGIRFPPGSILVLASDGVWEHVPEAEAAEFCCGERAKGVQPRLLSTTLVNLARDRWPNTYSDDISAIVVEAAPAVVGLPETVPAEPAPGVPNGIAEAKAEVEPADMLLEPPIINLMPEVKGIKASTAGDAPVDIFLGPRILKVSPQAESFMDLGFAGDSRLIVADCVGRVAFCTQDHFIVDSAAQQALARGAEVQMAQSCDVDANRVCLPDMPVAGIVKKRSFMDLMAHSTEGQHTPEVLVCIRYPPGNIMVSASGGVWEPLCEAVSTMLLDKAINNPLRFDRRFVALGIDCEFEPALRGFFRRGGKPARLEELDGIGQQVVATGGLPRPLVRELRRRLGSARKQMLSRCGASAIRRFGRPGASTYEELHLGREVLSELTAILPVLQAIRPRELQADLGLPCTLFVDGAYDPIQGHATVGAVLFAHGMRPRYFGVQIPDFIISRWTPCSVAHMIGQTGLLPLLIAKILWQDVLAGAFCITFVDNELARHSAFAGISPVLASAEMLSSMALLDAQLGVMQWLSRVPSAANVAGDLSRLNFRLVREQLDGEDWTHCLTATESATWLSVASRLSVWGPQSACSHDQEVPDR